MTSKDALKNIKTLSYCKQHSTIQEWCNIISQDLDKLEKFAHENASLHTELDNLQSSIKEWEKYFDRERQMNFDLIIKQTKTIDKLKKVIKILRNRLDIEMYEIHENGVTEGYLDCSQ